jgi:opacity protein-like surface antigen
MKKVCLIAALASALAPLPLFAQSEPDAEPAQVEIEAKLVEGPAPGHELGIDIFNQDTRAGLPSPGPSIQTTSGSVLGLQLTYLYMLSTWYLIGSAGYGIGGETFESGPPLNFKDELRIRMLALGAGLGYMAPITDRIGLRTTMQILYQQSRATLESGGNEDDGPTYNALGLALALGTTYELTQRLKFRAELYNLYARGSIDEEDAKILEWVKFSCYRIGLSREF